MVGHSCSVQHSDYENSGTLVTIFTGLTGHGEVHNVCNYLSQCPFVCLRFSKNIILASATTWLPVNVLQSWLIQYAFFLNEPASTVLYSYGMQFAHLHLIVALSVIIHVGVTPIFSVDDNILNYLELLCKTAEFFKSNVYSTGCFKPLSGYFKKLK